MQRTPRSSSQSNTKVCKRRWSTVQASSLRLKYIYSIRISLSRQTCSRLIRAKLCSSRYLFRRLKVITKYWPHRSSWSIRRHLENWARNHRWAALRTRFNDASLSFSSSIWKETRIQWSFRRLSPTIGYIWMTCGTLKRSAPEPRASRRLLLVPKLSWLTWSLRINKGRMQLNRALICHSLPSNA